MLNKKSYKKILSDLSRRDFLKFQLKGALFLAAGSSGLISSAELIAKPLPDIAVVKGNAGKATRKAVEMIGGIKSFVKTGNRVLIKPNMSFPNPPEWATTTNPEVVREMAVMCKEAGASSVLIADYTLYRPDECLKRTGIYDACNNIENVSVITANSERFYKDKDFEGAETMSRNGVFKEALETDVLISVPVAKSHSSAGVSLSMKGMMGLVWSRSSMHFKGLSTCIVDMCSVLRADLTLIDATRVLSTRGPGGPGDVLNENLVIASRDMVAADAYAVSSFEWYGRKYEPRQVGHIRKAHERGLGRMDVERLTVEKAEIM